jgi:hypothetical protein
LIRTVVVAAAVALLLTIANVRVIRLEFLL